VIALVSITLDNVTKRFGRVIAVNEASFKVNDGEFWVLLGPSGSGKTTLLYLISGIYKPTSGRIYFDDVDVTDMPPSERNVGLVFQNYALYPHMTVYENIAFPLRIQKRSQNEIEKKVREIAKMLHIENLLDRYPAQLSGGQQQRVALARALVKEPSVLLLDEPLSNLDALLRLYIRAELKRLQKDLGITAIYVTHDQVEAMAIADRIVVISHGKVQQIGSPEEIYNFPRNVFVATFVGTPPSNVIRGELASDGIISLKSGYLRVEPEASKSLRSSGLSEVLIAFRPEHIKLSREPIEAPGLILQGTVYAIEPLGRETLVTIVSGEDVIKCVLSNGESIKVGDELFVHVEREKIRLYHPETEELIAY